MHNKYNLLNYHALLFTRSTKIPARCFCCPFRYIEDTTMTILHSWVLTTTKTANKNNEYMYKLSMQHRNNDNLNQFMSYLNSYFGVPVCL